VLARGDVVGRALDQVLAVVADVDDLAGHDRGLEAGERGVVDALDRHVRIEGVQRGARARGGRARGGGRGAGGGGGLGACLGGGGGAGIAGTGAQAEAGEREEQERLQDRKSTRLNSSHVKISYAVV